MMSKHLVTLNVNGEDHVLYVDSNERLIDTLRHRIGLRSVKEGCGTGDCGSCTVLLDGRPVLSCLILTVQARDRRITTLEGLGKGDELHPLQEAFIEDHAVQCGYCTPAMILTAKALLDRNPEPSEEEIKEALGGVLCRCTGYYSIIRAVRSAVKKMHGVRRMENER